MATNARRSLKTMGQDASVGAHKKLVELDQMIATLSKVVAQTRVRVGGAMPDGSTRIVSLHDTDARPIRKGRLGRPVEFGYKAQVVDNTEGIVLDYLVTIGNPPDAPMLVPAIKRVIGRLGRTPKAVTADRGYGEADVEKDLEDLEIKHVVIPRKGKASAARAELQRSAGFVKLIKWRTGCEGRIATLKRNWGWGRTLMDGIDGAAIWCAWGVASHNSFKIANLATDTTRAPTTTTPRSWPHRPPGSGPPTGPPGARPSAI